ncbi:MAG TPA: VWA domain-containing protein [Candidatus Altiarchaeales archaeon]|nr:VWA domain-containing protein [Candidatus Altiarchaeales archaeon]
MDLSALSGFFTGMNVGFETPVYAVFAAPVFGILLYRALAERADRRRVIFYSTRILIVLLIAAAIAGPVQLESTREVGALPPITVLQDTSESMNVYDTLGLGQKIVSAAAASIGNKSLAGYVDYKTFIDVNMSRIGDNLYSSFAEFNGQPGAVILISDGNNNAGRLPIDVVEAFRKTNASLYVVKPALSRADWYVSRVYCEQKVGKGTEFTLYVDVGYTGNKTDKASLLIYVDGHKKFDKVVRQTSRITSHEFTLKLDSIGVHEVRVEILPESDDNIAFNNRFYKSVEVVETPRILLVTEKRNSPIANVFDRIYQVDVSGTLPSNFQRYSAIVFDNQPIDALNQKTNVLKNYLLDGGGMLVVGGKNAYDYGNYSNTHFETLLPVTSSTEPKEKRNPLAVIFLIDISKSTEYGKGDSKIDIEKAVLLRMLSDLNDNDSVGVIAFREEAYLVSPLSQLGGKRVELESKVRRLVENGGTAIYPALEMGVSMLQNANMDRIMILLSDGVTSMSDRGKVNYLVETFPEKGISLYLVGIGYDADKRFMMEAALRSGGAYYLPQDTERLRMEFDEKYDANAGNRLAVRDYAHYITQNLDVSSLEVDKLNTVYRKNAARTLVTTQGGAPILSIWRFGLGRIAALTTDNGAEWAPGLYSKDNTLAARTGNWVIGGLEKDKEIIIEPVDGTQGLEVEFYVQAKCRPKILLAQSNNVIIEGKVRQLGFNQYSIAFTPTLTGLVHVKAECDESSDAGALAVNYPLEYSVLNPDERTLERLAIAGGGRVYPPDEIESLVEEVVSRMARTSERIEVKKTPLWHYLAILTLALYFIDACARRIKVILDLKNG